MTSDPWSERLSEYLDGELGPEERMRCAQHLEGCAACRTLLAELTALVSAARALPERAPERDLWPALAARLAPARGRRGRVLLAFAAGVLATLLGLRLVERGPRTRVASAQQYLLLLHEPADFAAGRSASELAQLVERYSRWAADLGARCLDGEELEPDGYELRPGREPVPLGAGARVGGYFLLAAEAEDEALALARTCPHLAQGGWIELRRIRTH